MATASNNNLVKSIKSIKSIEGVPLEVALNIYQNDTWFNNICDPIQRFIKITNDNGNLKVEKKNSMETQEYKQVSKQKFIGSTITLNQHLINLCFSVWGNKGPYEVFVNLSKNNKNFPTENNKLAYLAHYAWIVSNDYSVESDEVVKEVFRKIQKEPISKRVLYGILGIDILSKTYENKLPNILNNNYFREYITMYDQLNNKASSSNKNNISIQKIKELLQLDLERAQLFVSKINPSSMSGGKRKNKKTSSRKSTRKSSKKTSKKNKKSMRKH